MKTILLKSACVAAILAGALNASPSLADTCDMNGVDGGYNALDANDGSTSTAIGSLACGESATTGSSNYATALGVTTNAIAAAAVAIGNSVN
jgi:hypothetical protein